MEDKRSALQTLNDVILIAGQAYNTFGNESEEGIKVRQILDVSIQKCLGFILISTINKEIYYALKQRKIIKMEDEDFRTDNVTDRGNQID